MTPEEYLQVINCKDKKYTIEQVKPLLGNVSKMAELYEKQLATLAELAQSLRARTEDGETIQRSGEPLTDAQLKRLKLDLRPYGGMQKRRSAQ